MRADTFGVDAPETQETIDMLLAMYQNQHHERLAETRPSSSCASPEDHVARLQDIIGELDQSVDFFLLERSRQAAIRVARDERLARGGREEARRRDALQGALLAGAPSCVPAEVEPLRARARIAAPMLGLGWQTAMDDEEEAVKREQDEAHSTAGTRATIAADLAEMGDPDDKSVTELLAEDAPMALVASRRRGAVAAAAAASTEAPPRRRARAGIACRRRAGSIPRAWPRARLRGRPMHPRWRHGLAHVEAGCRCTPTPLRPCSRRARRRRARVLRRLPVGTRRRRRERAPQPVGARVRDRAAMTASAT